MPAPCPARAASPVGMSGPCRQGSAQSHGEQATGPRPRFPERPSSAGGAATRVSPIFRVSPRARSHPTHPWRSQGFTQDGRGREGNESPGRLRTPGHRQTSAPTWSHHPWALSGASRLPQPPCCLPKSLSLVTSSHTSQGPSEPVLTRDQQKVCGSHGVSPNSRPPGTLDCDLEIGLAGGGGSHL